METSNDLADRQTLTSRLLNASRERVFEAITNPRHLVRWWGPEGFTNTFHEIDVTPGGKWKYTMHAPSGADYDNECVFGEITKPEKIVIQHLTGHKFELTLTLVAQGEQTLLNWNMIFEKAIEFEDARQFVIQGNEQNLDRLAAHLTKMSDLEAK